MTTRRRPYVLAALATLTITILAPSPPPASAVSLGALSKVHPALPAGGQAGSFAISNDSSTIFYLAEQAEDGVVELFAVRADGGTPVRLNRELATGEDVLTFTLTPNSQRVVYLVDRAHPSVDPELWSVSSSGGASTRLDAGMAGIDGVFSFAVSPDSSIVAFSQVHQDPGAVIRVYVSPVAGGPGIPLGTDIPYILGSDVFHVPSFTPDSSRVLMRDERTSAGVYDVYSASATGGPWTRLNPVLVGGGSVRQFMVTSDSSRVVYVADQIEDGVDELFSVPVAGGTDVRLNTALPAGSDVTTIAVTPDSARVVYRAAQSVADMAEVYSVPVGGGARTNLSSGMPVTADVGEFRLSPDGHRVIYEADRVADEVHELFSVATTGGLATRLNGDLPPGGDVLTFAVTPDSSRVVYLADQRADGSHEGFVSPIGGGAPVRLTDPLVDDGNAPFIPQRLTMAPDSSFVLFSAPVMPPVPFYLTTLVAPLSGAGAMTLHGPLVAEGSMNFAIVSPDSRYVVYSARQDSAQMNELYVRRVVPDAPPPPPGPGPVLPDDASAYTPLTPLRVFDSRPLEPGPGPKGLIVAGGSVDVQVAGVGDVPAGASAVVLNVTATGSLAPGFVTVWPTGQVQPLASSLNLTAAEQTRPNMVIVPVGAGGRVSMFSQAGTHLVADVIGYFSETSVAVSAGRLVPLPPARVFDTRPEEPAPGPKGVVSAGTSIEVQVGGVGGVPADAAAAVLNVTATAAVAPGFVTVWPTGRDQPLASTLNLTRVGDTTPNLVIVPLGTGGRVSLFSQAGADLLADVTGYVTAASAPVSTSGLFVPLPPARVFDTRPDEVAVGPKGFVTAGSTIDVQVGGVAGVPSSAGLVALNVTATQAATGFVTVFPGPGLPSSSTLNLNGPGDTRPNATLISVNPTGQVRMFSQAGAHLLADASGYTLP